jgi:hypothetical protein
MKRLNILIIIQLITRAVFGQLDSDFVNAKRAADYYFQTRDYTHAKKQYEIAVAIKENDVYCKERIDLINNKLTQLRKNKEEKAKYQAAQRNNATKNKPHYGTLKAQYDEDDEKFDYTGFIQNGQPEGHGIANYSVYDNNLGKEEGEWHDGKKYGKHRANYPNGDIYEAEYKEGLLNGKIIGNSVEHNYRYEFSYKNGKREGIQKIFTEEVRVEIFSVNGELEGESNSYYKNGGSIRGYYKNGSYIGEITMTIDGDKYTGSYKDGTFNGFIKISYANGNKYEGNVKDGLPNGIGKFIYQSGDILEGYFENDYLSIKGNATISFFNGDKYFGEYTNGSTNGNGKMSFNDGTVYDGHWLNDVYDGFGTLTINSEPYISNCPKCFKYVGWFLNSLKHGNGKCFDINGELIYDGKFENNIPIDKYPSEIKK